MTLAANYPAPPGLIDPRDVLLADAARILRCELEEFFTDAAVWDGPAGRQWPRAGSLDDADLARIAGALQLLARIERLQGRAAGTGPAWLNAILDGERAP